MDAITIALIAQPNKRKSVSTSTFSPSICHGVMGPDATILVFLIHSLSRLFHSSPSSSPNQCRTSGLLLLLLSVLIFWVRNHKSMILQLKCKGWTERDQDIRDHNTLKNSINDDLYHLCTHKIKSDVKVLVSPVWFFMTPCTVTRQVPLWNSSGKNTGVGNHSLLQGIFLIQGLSLSLLHCKQIPYKLSHQER